MHRHIRLLVIAWSTFALGSRCQALDLNTDPSVQQYFFAHAVGLPAVEREKTFQASEKRANFTFFDGVDRVAVDQGKLVFTLAGKKATLGWGDYMGKQPVAEIADMWQQAYVVRLRLKQSAAESQWTVRPWRDGERQSQTVTAKVAGQQWQELAFERLDTHGANHDGLELTIEGEPGTRFELEWLKLVQRVAEGYCRAEFAVPEGKIWRAVADVGSSNYRNWYGREEMTSRLYLNGKVVERKGARHLYHTEAVDIAPYLKPGRNCVGFFGQRIGSSPFLYFQARITMQSGEVVTVASGPGWKSSPRADSGWSEPGFNDSTWAGVQTGDTVYANSRDCAGKLPIPAYSGRLLMKNPTGGSLFYSDREDLRVEVSVPGGLKSRSPILSYLLGRADAEGRCALVKDGTVSTPTERGGSLVYELNLGRRSHGVYGLALAMKDAGGAVIDERPREPIVVLRKMDLKQVVGSEYTEGLDLELEDTIDFTNPADPHPWFESKHAARLPSGEPAGKIQTPTIIQKGGLTYREVTDAQRGSGFSYRVEFKQPGSFYYLELEYPDDVKRTFEVQVSSKVEKVWSNSQCGVGAETGGRFLPTGTMQKLAWLHVADSGPHSIDIINVVSGEKGAARSLKIHRVKGDLPSVATGSTRRYGIHTERCFAESGIGMNFGVDMPKRRRAEDQNNQLPLMQRVIQDLVWMRETGERYVQYLKFSGQNCHVMGCIQYNEYNTPYVPLSLPEDARVPHCMRSMMANLFQQNGIDFYAGIEFSQSQDVRTYANNAQVARGADTAWMVTAEGRQRYDHESVTIVPNWLHADVRRKYLELMDDLAATFGHLDRFRGIHGILGPSQRAGYWLPGFGWEGGYDAPLAASLDDVTMAQFTRDTGIALPIVAGDPQRFQKRASLLANKALGERFVAWRCSTLEQLLGEAVQRLRRHRTDLCLTHVWEADDPRLFQYLAASQRPFAEVSRAFGVDLGRLNGADGLCAGRWTVSWQQSFSRETFPSQNPWCWLARVSPDVISAFEGIQNRYVFVRTSWDENVFLAGGQAMKGQDDHDRLVESDWIMNAQTIRALPQPGGYSCREAFIQAIITGDPDLLLGGFTDLNVNVGHEQMLRSVLTPFTHLPHEKFQTVLATGLDTNVAIRQLNRQCDSWFYLANPCQWRIAGSLKVQTDSPICDVVSGKQLAAPDSSGTAEVPFSLTPFGLAAFRVASPKLTIMACKTDPIASEDMARLNAVLDRVGQLLANSQAELSLAPADRAWMEQVLGEARSAIVEGQYARAWSALTQRRFWSGWKDCLEPAATVAGPPPAAQSSEVSFDRSKNCIRIAGFPDGQPATLETLLEADRNNRWGKVRYDARKQSYFIDADVWIGDDRSDGTFVQIGDKEHPKVTAVVRGTIWVRPPRQSPSRSDGHSSVINRLTLGDPGDPKVQAALKFDCQTRGEHGLYVGFRPHGGPAVQGGELHVYHSTITAARQDPQHAWGRRAYTGERDSPRWGAPGWYASDLRLIDATVSWFEGCVAYGVNTATGRVGDSVDDIAPNPRVSIEGTTFEHGESAIQNGIHYLKGCEFRDLDVAIAEGGALAARLVGCVFQENRLDWTLGALQSRGIVMLDCSVSSQKAPPSIAKNRLSVEDAARQKIDIYPACRMRQSLVVKAVDESAAPVPNAWVTVSCSADATKVIRGAALTNQDGLTPSDPETDAIVVTIAECVATDEPNKPRITRYPYEVVIAKSGYETRTVQLPAGRPPARPLHVAIRKQAGAAPESPAMRTWADVTGRFQVQAILIGFDGTVARLQRPDGQVISVAIEKLSPVDRQFLESLRQR